jgi:hypothetical protein
MNKVNSNAHNYWFVRLGNGLLKLALTNRTAKNIIGDLEEAFNDRSETDLKVAKRWYLRQFVVIFISSISNRVKSDSSLNLSILGIAVIIHPVIFCLLAWLSNMGETTPVILQFLTVGQLNQIAEPVPTQVGPVLVFILLNIFYLLLPISFLVNKKHKQNNQYLGK